MTASTTDCQVHHHRRPFHTVLETHGQIQTMVHPHPHQEQVVQGRHGQAGVDERGERILREAADRAQLPQLEDLAVVERHMVDSGARGK